MVFEHILDSLLQKNGAAHDPGNSQPGARPRKPLKTNGFSIVFQWYDQDIFGHKKNEIGSTSDASILSFLRYEKLQKPMVFQ